MRKFTFFSIFLLLLLNSVYTDTCDKYILGKTFQLSFTLTDIFQRTLDFKFFPVARQIIGIDILLYMGSNSEVDVQGTISYNSAVDNVFIGHKSLMIRPADPFLSYKSSEDSLKPELCDIRLISTSKIMNRLHKEMDYFSMGLYNALYYVNDDAFQPILNSEVEFSLSFSKPKDGAEIKGEIKMKHNKTSFEKEELVVGKFGTLEDKDKSIEGKMPSVKSSNSVSLMMSILIFTISVVSTMIVIFISKK
eukprot:GAHX01000696.1.p1 GENE.GAHX01000696.1~~GAHX01000696.1.p1  ORF type:complete len:263 (-),score=47.09 GAHX01000696.1:177-923(-)